MAPFLVTLYAAHLPGGGAPVRAYFSGGTLLLEGDPMQRVPADAIRVEKGGFDDDGLFLNWQDGGVHYSAMPADAGSLQLILQHAPPVLAPQLARWRSQVGAQHFKWNAVLAVLASLLLAMTLLFVLSDEIAGWLAARVSPETEERLGKSALAQMKADDKLTQEGAAAEAVKSIGARLTVGSRYHYQWYVRDTDVVNAFAVPGGGVVVHRGLIAKTENAEELAAVLAHEVQHIELRHTLQQMIHSAGWAAMLALTLGDVSAVTAIIIHQAGNLQHSRKLEAQADAAGVKALVRAGISPAGLAPFFQRLLKEKTDEAGSLELLSTHPATAERIAAIEQLVKDNPCTCAPLAYDWKAVQASVKKPPEEKKKVPVPKPAAGAP